MNFQAAFDFYQVLMHANSLIGNKFNEYGFPWVGSIDWRKWEVFAAILKNDCANTQYRGNGCGADLTKHEIKSTINTSSSYEYQYQIKTGFEKLEDEKNLTHIYIRYGNKYKSIEVWEASGTDLADVFDGWKPQINDAYVENTKQRCRCTLAHSLVKKRGRKIMEIQDSKLVLPEMIHEKCLGSK